jgi:hypothetical protein
MQLPHAATAALALGALAALNLGASAAGRPNDPTIGSCQFCCAVYPSGWRGMCVRRCNAYRRWFTAAQRRSMPCDCAFNWRGEWVCDP